MCQINRSVYVALNLQNEKQEVNTENELSRNL